MAGRFMARSPRAMGGGVLAGWHKSHRAQGLGRVHTHHRAARHGQAAQLHMGLLHPAVVRCGQAGEALGHRRLGLAGLGGFEARLRGAQLRLGAIEHRLRHKAFGSQVACALEFGLGVGQLRLGLGHTRTCLGHPGLCHPVVDHRQQLAGLDAVTRLHQQLRHPPAGLRGQGGLAHRLHRGVQR